MIMIYWRWNKQKHNTAKFYTYIGEIKGYVYPNLVLQNSCTSYFYFDLAKEVSSSFFDQHPFQMILEWPFCSKRRLNLPIFQIVLIYLFHCKLRWKSRLRKARRFLISAHNTFHPYKDFFLKTNVHS